MRFEALRGTLVKRRVICTSYPKCWFTNLEVHSVRVLLMVYSGPKSMFAKAAFLLLDDETDIRTESKQPRFRDILSVRDLLSLWCESSHGRASQVAQWYSIHLPKQEKQEMWIQSLGGEGSPEEDMATYSSVPAWKTPWTEEPGELQSMGLQRIGHGWAHSQISWKPQGHPGKSLTATNPNLHVRKARASKAYWQDVQGHTVSKSKAKTEDWSGASRSHTVYIWVWASFPVGAVLCIPGCLAASLVPTHWMPVPPSCDNWKCLQGLPWWFNVVEISPSNAGVQVRSLIGELGSHVPLSQKTKT